MASPLHSPDPCCCVQAHLLELTDASEGGASIPRPEMLDLLAHAAACPGCAADLRSYRATVSLIRSLPRRLAPADFLAWVPGGRGTRAGWAPLNGYHSFLGTALHNFLFEMPPKRGTAGEG